MKGLYVRGVAVRDGPGSCAGAREGAGEALIGVCAGWAIEPRNRDSGCRRCPKKRKAVSVAVLSRAVVGSRGVGEPGHVHDLSMRENREVPRSPAALTDAPSWMVRGVVGRRWSGREGNAEAVRP